MNKVALVGRLTRDVETNTTTAGKSVARFSIAINRKFKNAEGNYEADFINCIAFSNTADFISKYFSKGNAIGIAGRIQTGSYTNKDGNKVYTTDIVVEEAEFVESKNASGNTSAPANDINDFMPVEDEDDELELPFN